MTTAAPQPVSASTSYVGRCYFYAATPQDFLDAGYDRIKVYRRKTVTGPWEELTTKSTRLPIRADQKNYTFVDVNARRGYQYRPTTSDSTGVKTDVAHNDLIQDALDTAYETVWTPQEIRDIYCWGLLGLFEDDEGEPFPDRLWVHYIRSAIEQFQGKTSMLVIPTAVEERHDWMERDGVSKIQVDQYPFISVEDVSLLLPGSDPITLPEDWRYADGKVGTVTLQPTSPITSQLIMNPFGLSGRRWPPNCVRVRYTAGFPLGQIPEDIKDVIGKMAAIGPLNIGGDLVGGAAIASQSIGVDGVSQSVNTTSSPSFSGFGARLLNYFKELQKDVPAIRKYYKGFGRLYVG